MFSEFKLSEVETMEFHFAEILTDGLCSVRGLEYLHAFIFEAIYKRFVETN